MNQLKHIGKNVIIRELSRADYVAVQTDDDEWLGPFLQTVLREAVAKSKPFVHCQAEWLIEGKVHLSPFPVMQPTYLSLIQGNKIGHSLRLFTNVMSGG